MTEQELITQIAQQIETNGSYELDDDELKKLGIVYDDPNFGRQFKRAIVSGNVDNIAVKNSLYRTDTGHIIHIKRNSNLAGEKHTRYYAHGVGDRLEFDGSGIDGDVLQNISNNTAIKVTDDLIDVIDAEYKKFAEATADYLDDVYCAAIDSDSIYIEVYDYSLNGMYRHVKDEIELVDGVRDFDEENYDEIEKQEWDVFAKKVRESGETGPHHRVDINFSPDYRVEWSLDHKALLEE